MHFEAKVSEEEMTKSSGPGNVFFNVKGEDLFWSNVKDVTSKLSAVTDSILCCRSLTNL